MHLKALEALLAVDGRLACNVKVLVEGEEEVGGPTTSTRSSEREGERLRCDALVISDSAHVRRRDAVDPLSLRGMAALRSRLERPATDLHSGMYGGVAPNAADALVRLLATLHDDRGVVAVDGFYDGVLAATEEELAEWQQLPFDEDELRTQIGARSLIGADGRHSALERMWTRPTLDLHGVWGGFTGEGIKTVIPAEARAKLSCRLVPEQTPERVLELVIAHLERHRPSEATLTIEWTSPARRPWRCAATTRWCAPRALRSGPPSAVSRSSSGAAGRSPSPRSRSGSSASTRCCSGSASPRTAPTRPTSISRSRASRSARGR